MSRAPDYRVDESGCWIWQKAINDNGYGRKRWRGRLDLAHRAAYEQHVGRIPEGHDIHHRCSTKECVNPEHLEAVMHRDHAYRHFGGLTPEQIEYVITSKEPCRAIAPKVGISYQAVNRLRLQGAPKFPEL